LMVKYSFSYNLLKVSMIRKFGIAPNIHLIPVTIILFKQSMYHVVLCTFVNQLLNDTVPSVTILNIFKEKKK